MSSKNSDILQIKKYLEGKLDARAMYELERRAQDDPFLMDAIEGYGNAEVNNGPIGELTGRLQHRLEKPKGDRVISMAKLAMAASVIGVLSVGGWWMYSHQVVSPTQVVAQAEADKTMVAPSPLAKQPEIIINKDSLIALNTPKTSIRSARSKSYYNAPITSTDMANTADETAENAPAAIMRFGDEETSKMVSQAKKDSVPLDEMLVMGYATARKKEAVTQNVDKAVAGRVAGLNMASAPATQNIVKGKVVSAEDGQPLPGVTVRADNSGNAVFTDTDGFYTLITDSVNTKVTFNYLGFNTRQLNVTGNALTNTVALEPQSASLNEVVIVDPAAAHPKVGWKNFQEYLNANSVSPNGKTGSYRVSFTVGSDGSLNNFEINKADNDVAGQKAIQLIKNGPEWVGSPRGPSKKITVTVKLRKAEK